MKKKLENISKTCFLTGQSLKKNTSLRFTLSPDREIIPDCYDKLSGKGIWIKPEKKIIKNLQKNDKVIDYFNGDIFFNPNLNKLVENLLKGKVLNQISLAKKAGLLVIGSDAVKKSFVLGKLRLVLATVGSKKLNFNRDLRDDPNFYSTGLLTKLDFEKGIRKKNVHYLGILCNKFKKTIQDDLNKLKDVIELK